MNQADKRKKSFFFPACEQKKLLIYKEF